MIWESDTEEGTRMIATARAAMRDLAACRRDFDFALESQSRAAARYGEMNSDDDARAGYIAANVALAVAQRHVQRAEDALETTRKAAWNIGIMWDDVDTQEDLSSVQEDL